MEFAARYSDGHASGMRAVRCMLDATLARPHLVIRAEDDASELDRWPADDIHPLPARRDELRLGASGRPAGARLVVEGRGEVRAVRQLLPALARHRRLEAGRQLRIVGIATAALASVVLAYVYGVPLLAGRIADMVPAEWEARLGTAAAEQIQSVLEGQGAGFSVCDPDPESLANRAIARFAAATVEGTGTPFVPDIQVIRSSVPNAFALPGGRSFYFSALLHQTRSADEFAGVMAHELGHVVHRHGMENLISTSATGLLIGFILGDMTGLSVAGGIGAALIDSRFSREAEREADRFAAVTAQRLGFEAAGLPELLERLAEGAEEDTLLAFLSTHPLTSERRAALATMANAATPAGEVFSPLEWEAIRNMCGPAPES